MVSGEGTGMELLGEDEGGGEEILALRTHPSHASPCGVIESHQRDSGGIALLIGGSQGPIF